MKVLVLEAIISVVYVFDVSAYPLMHIPFYMLTLLYFGSIVEILGVFRLGRYLARRLKLGRYYDGAKILRGISLHEALVAVQGP